MRRYLEEMWAFMFVFAVAAIGFGINALVYRRSHDQQAYKVAKIVFGVACMGLVATPIIALVVSAVGGR